MLLLLGAGGGAVGDEMTEVGEGGGGGGGMGRGERNAAVKAKGDQPMERRRQMEGVRGEVIGVGGELGHWKRKRKMEGGGGGGGGGREYRDEEVVEEETRSVVGGGGGGGGGVGGVPPPYILFATCPQEPVNTPCCSFPTFSLAFSL
jgi:hypothetical protein